MIIKFIVGVFRHIRDAFRNFFRNFMLSISALASINVTLIVVSASILLSLNFNQFVTKVENDVTIVAYVDNKVSVEDVEKLQTKLESNSKIDTIDYNTKDEELKILIEETPEISAISSQYEGDRNPLFNTFYIKAKDIKDIESLVNELESTKQFYKISYGEDVVTQIINMFNYARIIAVIIIVSLLLVTVFIIYNTIRITIYNRNTQIEIMRLIGASNYHISMPYVYEGILIGIFGSILPIVFTVFGYKYFYNNYADNPIITSFFDLIAPEPIIYYISGALLVGGIIVGMFGSALSVRRFLKR